MKPLSDDLRGRNIAAVDRHEGSRREIARRFRVDVSCIADVQEKRRSFRRKVKRIEAERLVSVDETGVTTAMTPTSARAPRGERAVDSDRARGSRSRRSRP